MTGIIVDDFETALKKLDTMIVDLKERITDLNSGFQDLTKSLKDNDLKFLTSKIDLELNYLNNVIIKNEAYYISLFNVLMSYKEQEQAIVNSIQTVTSKLKGEE